MAGAWQWRTAGAPSVPPEQFVAELAGQVVAALRDRSVDEAQRLARVDRLTAGAFDLDRTARIALGRYWKTAPEAERQEFAALFKDYVLTSYGRRFHQFADRTFRVAGVAPAGEDVVGRQPGRGRRDPDPARLAPARRRSRAGGCSTSWSRG